MNEKRYEEMILALKVEIKNLKHSIEDFTKKNPMMSMLLFNLLETYLRSLEEGKLSEGLYWIDDFPRVLYELVIGVWIDEFKEESPQLQEKDNAHDADFDLYLQAELRHRG
jgi:hypothetical protein